MATLPASGSVPPPAYDVVVAPGPGDPLPQAVRAPLQRSLGIDLEDVRVHDDRRARDAARSVGARAFTYGVHVYLNDGESATNLDLMSHEVAHAVQQQGGPAMQAYGGRSDALEREAASVSQSVRQGEQVRVGGRTAPRVQRSWVGRAWDATGGRVVHAVEEGVEAGIQWLEDRAWGLVRRFAPELEPILRQGIIEWLKERIGAALEAVWNTLMAPVRSVTDFIETLRGHFRNLVDWMREAATKLAHGDCSSISEAAQKVQDVVSGLASPVIDRVKHAAQRVGDFFTNLWNRFGAPVWQWLRELGGAIWERIQAFGSWLWEKTQPIRDALSRAWTWIKNKLGVGEGPEGQNGLLQWVQRKAGEAWDWLKARIEPYKRQLLVIAGVLVMLSPAGPIIAIAAVSGGLIYGARWLAQRLRSRDAVVQDRGLLEGRIIPGIQNTVNTVAGVLSRAAAWVTDKLTTLVGHFSSAAGAIAGSIFRFALGAVQWLLSRFQQLAAWASEQVQGVAGYVRSGLNRLLVWLAPVLEVLRKLGRVVANIFAIVELVVGRIWNAIPACIRNPIVDFVTNQILRRIPIFSTLLAIPDIWTRIRTTAMTAIRQVFRDGDLAGAAMTVFRFLLDVLQVPIDLVRAIFTKAASVFDLILADPVRFLRNVLSALKQGFVQFFGAIGRHLLNGVVNWLFGQLQQAGITVPTELSFGSIFRLILDILGITLERVLTILARKVGQPVVDRIRRMLGFLTGVWEFVSRLITEGPAGLWRYLVERLSNLWETARDMIIGWITNTIIGQVSARLLSMLDPTGIMAVVNSIIAFYRAVQSALEYLRQILEIVNTWLDTLTGIATGAIGAAATMFENLLDRAMPVAIGFLANQVGLRGLGRRIHEMIEAIQERVEQGIEWLIDRALAAGRAILERLGLGPATGGSASASFGEGPDRHTVTADEEGGRPRTMLATTPTPARQAVDAIIARIPQEIPAAAGRDRALQLARNTRREIDRWENPPAGAPAPAQGSAAYVQRLAELLGPLYGLIGHPDAPETVMQSPTVAANGMASAVEARPLTRKAPAGAPGQDSTSAPIPSDTAMRAMNAVRQMWVKLHLISFRLHGRDQSTNFAPGNKAANDAMERVEWEVIEALRASEGRAVWAYRTEVVYRTRTLPPPSPNALLFPRLITMRRGPYDPVGNRLLPGYHSTSIESPSPTAGAASLSSASVDQMVSVGIPRTLAQTVYDGRALFGRPYRSPDDLVQMITQTARFAPARLVGGQLAVERQVDALNNLLRAGTVVWQDQEAD
ncbi:MAG TPA: DUF4157 domain-containing protein [Gaiellaceae bacterium]